MSTNIVALDAQGFSVFADYMDDHLSDNGVGGTPLFQPIARADGRFSASARAEAFRQALDRDLSGGGWRRAWLALDPDGAIRGHVDLRAHATPHMQHRCLLGMGVDRSQRGRGLGRQLLAHALGWARHEAGLGLDWVDLQVLAGNAPAIALYEGAGFVHTGLMRDQFRIDGRSLDLASMSLDLGRSS